MRLWVALAGLGLLGCVTEAELRAALDRDGDGFLPVAAGGGDCDNSDAAVHPRADELCGDGLDNNCDGLVDVNGIDQLVWFVDMDADGFGTAAGTATACDQPLGHAATADDCNDADPAVRPGVTDLCDGVDTDCDGTVDEDAVFAMWHPDADEDDAGAAGGGERMCNPPDGWTLDGTDCDDLDWSVQARTWFADVDGDSYGDPESADVVCLAPTDHVADASDCDDTRWWVNPAMPERCGNGLDDDCDGQGLGCGLRLNGVAARVVPTVGTAAAALCFIDDDAHGDVLHVVDAVAPDIESLVGPVLAESSFIAATGMLGDAVSCSSDSILLARETAGPHAPWLPDAELMIVSLPASLPAVEAQWQSSAIPTTDIQHTRFGAFSTLALGFPSLATIYGVHVYDPDARGDELRLQIVGTPGRYLGVDLDVLDADSDGVLDGVVAEPNTDGVAYWGSPGAVHILHDLPSATGIHFTDDAEVHLTDDGADGFAVRLETGDVNGDGHDDLITHTPSLFGGASLDGSVEVFIGPFETDATRDDAWATAGYSLPLGIGLGDAALVTVDGDTLLALGAPLYGGSPPTGRVYILQPEPGSFFEEDAVARLESESTTSMGGHLLVGDVDGDGFDDLIATGSQFHDEGAIHIFSGAGI
ncbi:MAG: hypothetical protein ACI8PZ_005734 [Myxococcota bacterium]|jgi:hypothetical protein